MKITFKNKDKNFIFSSEDNLLNLAKQYWFRLFERESLSVIFISEDEMKEYDSFNAKNDIIPIDFGLGFSPYDEYMGLYFSYHDNYGVDVVFICPDRIKEVSLNKSVSFDALLNKVFIHELAHSLMCDNVFSLSESKLYSIPSFKFFEESLCNAFALLHFSDNENDSLVRFCNSQPDGYRHFFIWDKDSIFASIDKFKSFKKHNHFFFNYLWISQNKDVLTDDKNKVLSLNNCLGRLMFNSELNVCDDIDVNKDLDIFINIFRNIFKLSGVFPLSIDVMKKSRDVFVKRITGAGFPVVGWKGIALEEIFLMAGLKTGHVYFFCLNINDYSIYSMREDLLHNCINQPYDCLIFSNIAKEDKILPGQKRILSNQLKIGMTMAEVLDIVGNDNLYEVTKIWAMSLPNSEKVMSFNSCGNPSGCILGFSDGLVDGIRMFSIN